MFKKTAMFALFLLALSGCKGKDTDKASPAQSGGTATVSATDSKIVPVGTSYGKGGKSPLVTIIEFSDFQCPFCSRVNPTMKKIMETYKDDVKIVFKHNPLSFHKKAPYASQACLAAGAQGKFWEMHDILFKNQRKIDPADIKKYAGEIGLDIAKFEKAVNSQSVKDQLKADMALATKVGARGTPNFIINGTQLSGAQPFPKFDAVIKTEIAAAKALIKAGTKREAVYAKRVEKNFKKPAARAKNKGKAAASKVVYKLPLSPTTASKGGKEPLVTIVEFSDFQCPFCSRIDPMLKEVAKDPELKGKVNIVFKHFPLGFHKDARPAAKASLAAQEQGKFWEYSDKLMANQKALKAENFSKWAKEIGLDVARFEKDLKENDAKYEAHISADQKLGSTAAKVRGTPSIYVGGWQLKQRSAAGIKALIKDKKLL